MTLHQQQKGGAVSLLPGSSRSADSDLASICRWEERGSSLLLVGGGHSGSLYAFTDTVLSGRDKSVSLLLSTG